MDNNLNELIGIILITYDHKNSIVESLNSVFQQKYPSIELIIVEDYSSSSSTILINEVVKKNKRRQNFKRVEYVLNEKNEGLVKSLNTGLSLLKSEIFIILSGDDYLPDKALEANYHFLQKCDCGISSGKVIIDSNESEKLHYIYDYNFYDYDFTVQNLTKENLGSYFTDGDPFLTLGVMFKKEIIHKYGGFDENYRLLEDVPLILKLSMDNIKYISHNFPTYIYTHGVGFSSGFNGVNLDYLMDLVRFYDHLLRILDSNQIIYSRTINKVRKRTKFIIEFRSASSLFVQGFVILKYMPTIIGNISLVKIKNYSKLLMRKPK